MGAHVVGDDLAQQVDDGDLDRAPADARHLPARAGVWRQRVAARAPAGRRCQRGAKASTVPICSYDLSHHLLIFKELYGTNDLFKRALF